MRYWLLAAVLLLTIGIVTADDDDGWPSDKKCGDDKCHEKEDCSSCPEDCGVCEHPTEIIFSNHVPVNNSNWTNGEPLGVDIDMGDEDEDIDMYVDDEKVEISIEGEGQVTVRLDEELDLEDERLYRVTVVVDDAFTRWHFRYKSPEPIDTTPPQITILSPLGSSLDEKTFWLNLTTDEEATCTCEGPGAGEFVPSSISHFMLIDLGELSEAEYRVECIDLGGNAASVDVNVEYEESEPPAVNNPPRWTQEPISKTYENKPLISINYWAKDDDNDSINYNLDTHGVDFAQLKSGKIEIRPPEAWIGLIEMTLTATDGKETISKDFIITIIPKVVVNKTDPPDEPPVNDTPQVNETPSEPAPRRGGGGGGGSRRRDDSLAADIWTCGAWTACLDGIQEQECKSGYLIKTNERNCTVIVPTTSFSEPVNSTSVIGNQPAAQSSMGSITGQSTYEPPEIYDYKKPIRWMIAGWVIVFLSASGYAIKRRYY